MSDIKNTNADAPIKKRLFWTWDHTTEWALNRPGSQTTGTSNYYGRTPEDFVEDYSNLLRWCGQHNINAVVVWGLLRDSHGGVESVKRLCDVANENDVKLLCGVGLNSYNGVYYEGDSPASLIKHLISHPDLYAKDADGKKMVFDFGLNGSAITHFACPSRKENQQFAAESLKWLFETLPGLGGVQMEAGDCGVCMCELCRKRRQYSPYALSWEDMALMYPIAVDAIRSVSPDAFIVCETYSNPVKRDDSEKPLGFGEGRPIWSDECLARFPDGVYVQWRGDNVVKPVGKMKWTDAGTINDNRHHHIMRTHHSTYWEGIRGEVAFDWLEEMVQQSMAHGMDCTSIFGEVSPFNAGAELNYLALENYGSANNPTADMNIFIRDVAGPLLGGEDAAHDYLKYARMRTDRKKLPDALKHIYSYCGKLPPESARRWAWLACFLESSIYP